MKVLKLPGGEISIFNDIFETPQLRYHAIQKYALQDSGIGSDMDSVNRHFNNLHTLIQSDTQKAIQEARNLHFNIYLQIEGINITSLSFACMVSEIKGKPQVDFNEERLKRVVEKASDMGLTQGMVIEELTALKKNLIPSFTQISLSALLAQNSKP